MKTDVSLMIVLSVRLLFLSSAMAQEQPARKEPMIKGVVMEAGTQQPISNADVTLRAGAPPPGPPVILARAKTDDSGHFSIPLPMGDYYLTVTKEGYSHLPFGPGASSYARFALTDKSPSKTLELYLDRGGELTGRVVDADTGRPLEGLRVIASRVFFREGLRQDSTGGSGTSDHEGRFTIAGLLPGEYVASVPPKGRLKVIYPVTDEATNAKQLDFARLYWPGGTDKEWATPVLVLPGLKTDVGVLQARTVPYYNLKVSTAGSPCHPEETVYVLIGRANTVYGEAPCGAEFLVSGLNPGSSSLMLYNGAPRFQNVSFARVPFAIVDRNEKISAVMSGGTTVDGQLTLADNAAKTDLAKVSIFLYPLEMAPASFPKFKVSAEGTFQLLHAPPGRFQVSVFDLPEGYYVESMRYNNTLLSCGTTPQAPYSMTLSDLAMAHKLEVRIDDQPAAISGAVRKGEDPVGLASVALVKWPLTDYGTHQQTKFVTPDSDGTFRFTGLAPGNYRIVAVTQEEREKLAPPGFLERLLQGAKELTLSRGKLEQLILEPRTVR